MPARYSVCPVSKKHTAGIQVKAEEIEKLVHRVS